VLFRKTNTTTVQSNAMRLRTVPAIERIDHIKGIGQ
jgi:hypothetical protein